MLQVAILFWSCSLMGQPLVDSLSADNYYAHDGQHLEVWEPEVTPKYGSPALVKFGPFENYDCQGEKLDEIRKRERIGLNTKFINQTSIFSESMNVSFGEEEIAVDLIAEHVKRHTANTLFGFLTNAEDEYEEDEEEEYWTMIKWSASIPGDSINWNFVSEYKDKIKRFGENAMLGRIENGSIYYDVKAMHLKKKPSRENASGRLYVSISHDGKELALCEIGGKHRVLMPLALNDQEKKIMGVFMTSFLAVRYQH